MKNEGQGGAMAAQTALGFADVEARLIEAMRVWAWGTGGEPRSWASDGPWSDMRMLPSELYGHLGQGEGEDAGDASARAMAAAIRMPRPDRAMIGRAEEAGRWLALIAREEDRRIVVRALAQLAKGHGRVNWGQVTRPDPAMRGRRDWARVRYSRAIGAICQRLSGVRSPFDGRALAEISS